MRDCDDALRLLDHLASRGAQRRWCFLANDYRSKRLSHGHLGLIVKRLAKKARLKKMFGSIFLGISL